MTSNSLRITDLCGVSTTKWMTIGPAPYGTSRLNCSNARFRSSQKALSSGQANDRLFFTTVLIMSAVTAHNAGADSS